MKIDFIQFVSKVFMYFSEEEKIFFTQQTSFNFGECIATLIKEMDTSILILCLRILGDLLYFSDSLSFYLIVTKNE